MFDWNEEELTNMIWGGDGETGDHIVPIKGRSKQLNRKEGSEECNKQAEEKTEIGVHDGELGSSSGRDVDEGVTQPDFCMSSWPESSLSKAKEADPVSKCLAEPEKTSELGKGPDIFHSTDGSKARGDFDEYGWASIGSFDDLDRMFSNDVPTFGDDRLIGADELWPSFKDASNSASKALPSILNSEDLGLDIRAEQKEDQQFRLTGNGNGLSFQSVPNVRITPKSDQYHKGQLPVTDQPYQQNKMMKFSKMSGTFEAGAHQDLYSQRALSRNSPEKFANQLTPSLSSLMAINMHSESQGSETLHYQHMPSQYIAASGFGNHTNPYSTVPLLSTAQCPDVNNQLMHPSYNPAMTISVNMATDTSVRPPTMTPQEKLEKLRRRQQMQAMLAIQRQQQQFRHQVPVADQSITLNCPQVNPLVLVDKTNLQGLTAMPSFDPNSSLQLNDSGNLAAAGDNSAEFLALYRLQDVVSKLDMGVRTCIRDSLFRLAGSAGQRHHISDTANINKTSQDDQDPKEESRYRCTGMPDAERVTNPTDRTVAHLLFHRPFDMLAAKHMKGPESPASSKIGTEESRTNKQKGKVEERPAGSLGLGNPPNSGSSSTVGEASQGTKRKL